MTETPDLFGHAPKKKVRRKRNSRKFEFDSEGNLVKAECLSCKELVPRSEFCKAKRSQYGIQQWCNSCKKWDMTRFRHGITRQEWEHMYAHQGGKCKICKNPLGEGRSTHIDHCHVTNKVASLLCNKCNRGLGFAGENPEILLAMAEYAKKHKVAKKELGDTDDGF